MDAQIERGTGKGSSAHADNVGEPSRRNSPSIKRAQVLRYFTNAATVRLRAIRFACMSISVASGFAQVLTFGGTPRSIPPRVENFPYFAERYITSQAQGRDGGWVTQQPAFPQKLLA